MRIPFDQGTAVPLRAFLAGHVVSTAFEEGWSRLENGALLNAAEAAGFECFVTTDQRIRYQQQLSGRKIRIVVLLSTSWPKLKPRHAEIAAVISRAAEGSYPEVPV